MSSDLEKLKFPIGSYQPPKLIDEDQISIWINEIKTIPKMIRERCSHLDDNQLDTPYRPGGWTLRQVVHHVAESHMNSLIRFKWTLTEDKPIIKAYHEDRWSELDDSKLAPIDNSLNLIDALHHKWVLILNAMTFEDFSRTFIHPELKKEISLAWTLGMYVWHGNHHYEHINQTMISHNW